jgi:hypothetical protein
MRGRKSFGVIARELGISRNVVAGVCFRADYDRNNGDMVASPASHAPNMLGTGYRSGPSAPQTLRNTPA